METEKKISKVVPLEDWKTIVKEAAELWREFILKTKALSKGGLTTIEADRIERAGFQFKVTEKLLESISTDFPVSIWEVMKFFNAEVEK